jgi:hypothetical protein
MSLPRGASRAFAALLLAAGCAPQAPMAPSAEAPAHHIRVVDPCTIEVGPLPADAFAADRSADDWAALFAVYVEPRAGRPPLLGSYTVAGDALRFMPRFPLAPGVRYCAVFRPDRLTSLADSAGPVEQCILLETPSRAESAFVDRIYPTADLLPENQLKFYVHFSFPMSRGEAYEHIRLLDADGKPVERPFLELGEELWDAEGRRFTLFIDPGRIKRGLKPREDLGPALMQGKRYTLVIDRDWPDAEGAPLQAPHRKQFAVGPPLETTPDPKTWRIASPTAGGRTPLILTFPGPLDHALLHRLLWVEAADGRRAPGSIDVTEAERRWTFTPAEPWAAGDYHLVADTHLEDLAGNGIGRPFEVDVLHLVEEGVKPEVVRIPFAVTK